LGNIVLPDPSLSVLGGVNIVSKIFVISDDVSVLTLATHFLLTRGTVDERKITHIRIRSQSTNATTIEMIGETLGTICLSLCPVNTMGFANPLFTLNTTKHTLTVGTEETRDFWLVTGHALRSGFTLYCETVKCR
jgi:hypothetical protein